MMRMRMHTLSGVNGGQDTDPEEERQILENHLDAYRRAAALVKEAYDLLEETYMDTDSLAMVGGLHSLMSYPPEVVGMERDDMLSIQKD